MVKEWESSYLCFSANPVYLVDVLGDNADGYIVDKKGNISRAVDKNGKVDKTGGDDFDVLWTKESYMKGERGYDSEGTKGKGIQVNNKDVLPSLSSRGKQVEKQWGYSCETGEVFSDTRTMHAATSKDGDEMMNLFVFLANSSSQAEWRLHYENSGVFNLSTLHAARTSADDGDLGVETSNVVWMVHSHPDAKPGFEREGFDTDRGASKHYSRFYVYTPQSGYIWRFELKQTPKKFYRIQSFRKAKPFRDYILNNNQKQ